ncbi:hypothetical protein TCAL_02240 [Tigriopus californicus]|uniref:Pyridoxal kinase n=1 Tax=Tigriopus californicus TaxID=6832 RepID=A0A553P6J4_TIGCA|nr:hypothetical protein TCAL_02240 [Tigriopus californicus]
MRLYKKCQFAFEKAPRGTSTNQTIILKAMHEVGDRILSIQSHVVSGYVGNKSATFPLQLLGFEVDAINSVQFSNHTGYAHGIRGQVLGDTDLWDLIEGLRINEIDSYSHIINGYIGSPSFLVKLAEVVKTLKVKNPDLVYVCDPVMGDMGPGLYVPETLLPIYQNQILPLADICLPNQFEIELLTGMKVNTESEALEAMGKVHDLGVGTVILSSTELAKDRLIAIASTRDREDPTRCQRYKIEIPKFPAAFVGTGDLFTALSTAWLRRSGNDVKMSLEKTIATMQVVLGRTLEQAQKLAGEGNKPTAHQMELKLIQSKEAIETPVVSISATKIT